MFCFRCAEKMIVKNGHRYCQNGDMYLSEVLNNKLTELFEEKSMRTFPKDDIELPKKRFFCLNLQCDNIIQNLEGKCAECNSEMREITIYCPECGIPMQRNSEISVISDFSCVACKKVIDKNLLYQIIELHPHKPF